MNTLSPSLFYPILLLILLIQTLFQSQVYARALPKHFESLPRSDVRSRAIYIAKNMTPEEWAQHTTRENGAQGEASVYICKYENFNPPCLLHILFPSDNGVPQYWGKIASQYQAIGEPGPWWNWDGPSSLSSTPVSAAISTAAATILISVTNVTSNEVTTTFMESLIPQTTVCDYDGSIEIYPAETFSYTRAEFGTTSPYLSSAPISSMSLTVYSTTAPSKPSPTYGSTNSSLGSFSPTLPPAPSTSTTTAAISTTEQTISATTAMQVTIPQNNITVIPMGYTSSISELQNTPLTPLTVIPATPSSTATSPQKSITAIPASAPSTTTGPITEVMGVLNRQVAVIPATTPSGAASETDWTPWSSYEAVIVFSQSVAAVSSLSATKAASTLHASHTLVAVSSVPQSTITLSPAFSIPFSTTNNSTAKQPSASPSPAYPTLIPSTNPTVVSSSAPSPSSAEPSWPSPTYDPSNWQIGSWLPSQNLMTTFYNSEGKYGTADNGLGGANVTYPGLDALPAWWSHVEEGGGVWSWVGTWVE